MKNSNAVVQIFVATVLLGAVVSAAGCASHRETTVTRTTEVRDDGNRGSYSSTRSDPDRTETRVETSRVEEDHDDPDRGLFGIIGNIIALPFRAVGAVFEAIF